jgi:hypothetical protein
MGSRIYFDTCIISGIAKNDLARDEMQALFKIIQSPYFLCTSEVSKDEIEKIPKQFRIEHSRVYELLLKLNTLPIVQPSMLMLMGVGGGGVDPLFAVLKEIPLGDKDAEHLFQALKNNVDKFITTDQKTILKHSSKILEKTGLMVYSPVQYAEVLDKEV